MKPLHYVRKYGLDKSTNFDHNEFIQDLTTDFLTLLEVGKTASGKYVLAGFENTVRAIRQKWDSISNKTSGELPDKLWNYFYATVICKMREELFPNEMKRRQQEKEDREKHRAEYKDWEQREFGFYDHFFGMFNFLFKSQNKIPTESFEVMKLTHESSEEEIKDEYRKLSKLHHPDKGGDSKRFMEITEAKNKCLIYVKNKV